MEELEIVLMSAEPRNAIFFLNGSFQVSCLPMFAVAVVTLVEI